MQRRGGAGLEVLRHLRQQARVGRFAAAFVLAAATAALFAPPLAEVARFKPFWLDEGFEIAEACRHPYLWLLVNGAPGQCSPSPLYYLAQRASVRSIARFDEGIAVAYRRVSLTAAAMLLLLTVAVLFLRLGPPWGLAAAASLASQPLFVHYAAENRPYLAWLLLFALTVLIGAEAATRRWREVGRVTRLALAASSVALSLVALPGALQAALACAVCGLAWLRRAEDRAEARAALRWALLLGAGCVAAGLYFGARSPCRDYDAGALAFEWPDRAGRLRPVLALLWGDGVAGGVGNVLFLLGLVSALRLPEGGGTREAAPQGDFGSWLAAGVTAQLGLTFILAAQVIFVGYYFLARVFLHLVVCRALLIAAGGWYLVRGLEPRAAGPARLAMRTLASGLAVLAVATAYTSVRDMAAGVRTARPAAGGPCAEVDGALAVVVPAGTTDWALGPNFIVRLGREKSRCGHGSAGTRHVLAAAPEAGFRVSSDRPPDTVPLEQCGRPVVLGP